LDTYVSISKITGAFGDADFKSAFIV